MVTSVVKATRRVPAAHGSAENGDAQLLRDLAKLWATYRRHTLEVRRETGVRLNKRLGSPTKPQAQGRAVLKKVAKTLAIAESDLNRMRWYAYFSEDEKSCWGETPSGDRTWTLFRARLPGLIAAIKGNGVLRSSSGEKKRAVSDGLLRWIRSTATKLRADNFIVDGAKKEELVEGLRDLLSAIQTRLASISPTQDEDVTGSYGPIESIAESGCESNPELP